MIEFMAKPQIQKIQCFGFTSEIDADEDQVNLQRVGGNIIKGWFIRTFIR